MALPVEVIRSPRRRKTVSAREVDGVVRIQIPAWMSAAEEARWVKEMLRRLERSYSPASDADLTRRANTLAQRYDLPQARIAQWSKRQDQRWGSCTPESRAIRISDRLRRAPQWVTDYVIVHELAHLASPGHDNGFRDLVGRYEKAERALGFLDALSLSGDAGGMASTVAIDHVQLAMPPGPAAEAAAEAFYAGLLEIPRVPKPALLALNGGCWFERGPLRIHLGVEVEFRPARKAHPAIRVVGIADLVRRLEEAGVTVRHGDGLENAVQVYVNDPFGNRIELIERER